jgi:hypothetical protein
MARPTSIRIFLADGTPDGIRIVEKSNWTGRAVVAGRPQLSDALRRDELNRPGVYVLVGTDEGGGPSLYVGEAEVLGERLRNHAIKKDFWTWFVAFSSTDENLNKANIRFLESRLLELARAANQWGVTNNTAPAVPPMSEADRADAEWFLQETLLIYPILGIDAFEPASTGDRPSDAPSDYILSQRGAEGRGRETTDGFVVLAGSRARSTQTPSIHAFLVDTRQRLRDRGVLEPQGDHLVFAQDFRFTSPSTAASVLVGGNANGRKAWKTPDGRTLKQVQDARAAG